MAEFNNAPHIGPFLVAPTEEQAVDVGRYDKALGLAGREGHLRRPASYMPIDLPVQAQVPSGGSAESVELVCPWPMTLLQAQGAYEVGGGALSALTFDIQVNKWDVDTAAYLGYASILDAPEDVFPGGAQVPGLVAPEDGSEELNYLDKIKVIWAATGDVADGASVKFFTKRR
jgi:hypothetical protein